MLVIIITALLILLVSLIQDGNCSTNVKDSIRNDYDMLKDMLNELLQRCDKMERSNNKRFDQMESHMNKIQSDIEKLENDNTNLSTVMETIVEQQMVITAEIFTVSQTLPFCCCQYQNTTDPPEIKTTTTDSGKPETTTPTTDSGKPETTTPTTLTSSPSNCAEAMGENGPDGIYQINVTNSNIGPFDVYCMNKVAAADDKIINGKWLIIQRRQPPWGGDFYHNWAMYQRGFGELTGSFWLGLDKIHALTKTTDQELWIELETDADTRGWAKYSHFSIGSEKDLYKLKSIGNYSGTAGNSLFVSVGSNWSTKDKDNDGLKYHCAQLRRGAWWFKYCKYSNLNGDYGWDTAERHRSFWYHFCEFCSFKYSHMAVRPVEGLK